MAVSYKSALHCTNLIIRTRLVSWMPAQHSYNGGAHQQSARPGSSTYGCLRDEQVTHLLNKLAPSSRHACRGYALFATTFL